MICCRRDFFFAMGVLYEPLRCVMVADGSAEQDGRHVLRCDQPGHPRHHRRAAGEGEIKHVVENRVMSTAARMTRSGWFFRPRVAEVVVDSYCTSEMA